jgi:hypothetical protein
MRPRALMMPAAPYTILVARVRLRTPSRTRVPTGTVRGTGCRFGRRARTTSGVRHTLSAVRRTGAQPVMLPYHTTPPPRSCSLVPPVLVVLVRRLSRSPAAMRTVQRGRAGSAHTSGPSDQRTEHIKQRGVLARRHGEGVKAAQAVYASDDRSRRCPGSFVKTVALASGSL